MYGIPVHIVVDLLQEMYEDDLISYCRTASTAFGNGWTVDDYKDMIELGLNSPELVDGSSYYLQLTDDQLQPNNGLECFYPPIHCISRHTGRSEPIRQLWNFIYGITAAAICPAAKALVSTVIINVDPFAFESVSTVVVEKNHLLFLRSEPPATHAQSTFTIVEHLRIWIHALCLYRN